MATDGLGSVTMIGMEAESVLDYSRSAEATQPAPALQAMTGQQLAMLACRVLALWLFIGSATSAIAAVYYVIAAIGGPPRVTFSSSGPLLGLVIAAVPLATGVYLWARADRIAIRMWPVEGIVVPTGSVGYGGLMTIALAAVGVSLFVPCVSNLAGAVAYESLQHHNFSDWWRDAYWTREFWMAAVEIPLAGWLVFGGRGIVRIVAWARTAGHRADRAAEPTV